MRSFLCTATLPGLVLADGLHAQADTALPVDLGHLDLGHVTLGQLVADILHPLLANRRAVHQAVIARRAGDTSAEIQLALRYIPEILPRY